LVSAIIRWSEINMETSSAWWILRLWIFQREENNCSKKVSPSIIEYFAVKGRITIRFKAWNIKETFYLHYCYLSTQFFNKTNNG
jgi:hypothetical protein